MKHELKLTLKLGLLCAALAAGAAEPTPYPGFKWATDPAWYPPMPVNPCPECPTWTDPSTGIVYIDNTGGQAQVVETPMRAANSMVMMAQSVWVPPSFTNVCTTCPTNPYTYPILRVTGLSPSGGPALPIWWGIQTTNYYWYSNTVTHAMVTNLVAGMEKFGGHWNTPSAIDPGDQIMVLWPNQAQSLSGAWAAYQVTVYMTNSSGVIYTNALTVTMPAGRNYSEDVITLTQSGGQYYPATNTPAPRLVVTTGVGPDRTPTLDWTNTTYSGVPAGYDGVMGGGVPTQVRGQVLAPWINSSSLVFQGVRVGLR